LLISSYSRVIFYSLLLTFFALPYLPTYTVGFYGLAEPINSIILLPFLFIGFAAIKFVLKKNKKDLELSKNTLSLLLICVSFLFIYSIFFSNQLFELDNTKIKFFCIIYFLLFIQSLYWLKPNKLLMLVIIFYFLFSQQLYGLYQHFISSEASFYTSGSQVKMLGVVRQVNVFSIMIVMGSLVAFYLAYRLHRFRKYKAIVLCSLIYLLLTPVVLYVASSKSAYISFIASYIVLGVYIIKDNKRSVLKLPCLALILGTIITITFSSELKPTRTTEQISNISSRAQMYEHSLWMINEKPLVGWGANSFSASYHYSLMGRSLEDKSIIPLDNYIDHPHNELLLWGVELGLFGLIFIISIMLLSLKVLYKHSRHKSKPWALIILLPTFIHSQFEFPFYISSYIFIIFSLIFYIFIKPINVSLSSFKGSFLILLPTLFVTLNLILFVIWFSVLSAMKYTGEYSLEDRMHAKEKIFWKYSTLDYTRQVDHLIASFYASDDITKLVEVNESILETLKQLPSERLAITFLENCEKIQHCDEKDLRHLKSYFPYAFLKYEYSKKNN